CNGRGDRRCRGCSDQAQVVGLFAQPRRERGRAAGLMLDPLRAYELVESPTRRPARCDAASACTGAPEDEVEVLAPTHNQPRKLPCHANLKARSRSLPVDPPESGSLPLSGSLAKERMSSSPVADRPNSTPRCPRSVTLPASGSTHRTWPNWTRCLIG